MSQIVLLAGPTGSGKTVQGESLMAAHPNWSHISSGTLLRSDPIVASYLSRGELAPSAEVERLIATALKRDANCPVIVLDGFPRTLDEAHWFDHYAEEHAHTIRAIFALNTPEDVIRERLSHRLRSDDGQAAIITKLLEYETLTRPMIEYYRQQDLVTELDGGVAVETITQLIEARLHV